MVTGEGQIDAAYFPYKAVATKVHGLANGAAMVSTRHRVQGNAPMSNFGDAVVASGSDAASIEQALNMARANGADIARWDR